MARVRLRVAVSHLVSTHKMYVNEKKNDLKYAVLLLLSLFYYDSIIIIVLFMETRYYTHDKISL